MATKKKKKRTARAAPPEIKGADAVDAFVKAKQSMPTPGAGWLRGLVDAGGGILRKALATADQDDVVAIEKAIEERLVADRRVMKLAPNLGAKPEDVRITILEVQRLFGLPERTIRAALNADLMGGINFAGRTGWLTTVPEVRAYLKALENPGIVTRLEARVAELEASLKAAKRAA